MRKSVSREQSHAIIQILANNVDWPVLDGDLLQERVIKKPKEAGAQFTAFLKNGACIFIGKPKSIPTKPFNSEKFLDKGWGVWKGSADGGGLSGEEDIDQRSLDLPEINLSSFVFETCLQKGESSITGEEKLRRLKEKTEFIRFGANVFLGLWEDYQANEKNSVLEHLYNTQGTTYIDFFGTVLRSPVGHRLVLCLYRSGDGQWHWSYRWLGDDWDAESLSAGCAS